MLSLFAIIYDCQYWVSAGLAVLTVSLAVLLICFRGLLFSCMFCVAWLVFSQPASSASSLWLGSFFFCFTAFSFFIEVKLRNFMCHMHICRLILKLTNMCFLCSFCALLSLFLSLPHNIIHAYPALSLVRLPTKNRFKFYTKLTLCMCLWVCVFAQIVHAQLNVPVPQREKTVKKKRNQANLLVKMSAFAWCMYVCVCACVCCAWIFQQIFTANICTN